MFLAIPVWVGKKLHARYISATKNKRNLVVLGGVAASVSFDFLSFLLELIFIRTKMID